MPNEQRRPRRREGRRFFTRRKVCTFCVEKVKDINYKDVGRLRRYISDLAKIEPRRKTGTCARHQRDLAQAIKRARHLALLPFTPVQIRAAAVSRQVAPGGPPRREPVAPRSRGGPSEGEGGPPKGEAAPPPGEGAVSASEGGLPEREAVEAVPPPANGSPSESEKVSPKSKAARPRSKRVPSAGEGGSSKSEDTAPSTAES